MSSLFLSDFLYFPELSASDSLDGVIAVRDNKPLSHQEFLISLSQCVAALNNRPEKSWLLYCDDTFDFALLFLSLLCAGKKITLAPSKQEGTLKSLLQKDKNSSEACECLLSDTLLLNDQSINSLLLLDILNKEKETSSLKKETRIPVSASVVIATSGSTGESKLIEKPLPTFLAELDCLERLWGSKVDNTIFFSTVSHQHIYGLLFRLLWPLRTGRVFNASTQVYPEPLFKDIRTVKNNGLAKQAVLIASPAHLKRIPDAIEGDGVRENLSQVFSSGGPLAREDSLSFKRRFGLAPAEVFGSTETGGVAWRSQCEEELNPVWQALPDVQLSKNKEGCLTIRSPYSFCAEPFVMGDKVVLLDGEKFLHQGRSDRLIKLEEKRVSLTAMENCLLEHADISEAKVVHLQTAKREQLGAVLVLVDEYEKGGSLKEKRELNERFKNHLLPFFERSLLPRKWRYVNELPMNSQGKVTHDLLEELFLEKEKVGIEHIAQLVSQTTEQVQVSLEMSKHPEFFEGHFPDYPILPGVLQLDWVIRLAKSYWYPDGMFLSVSRIKFKQPVKPNDCLTIDLNNKGSGKISYTYTNQHKELMASGTFLLSNI